jgi:aspartate carbamoyltransferase catalytic subunit
MKNLLQISDLESTQIEELIINACHFKHTSQQEWPDLSSATCATLFYENSTRTLVSFELAAKRLKMMTVNLNIQSSSVNKGESILDTLENLYAMDINAFILRHSEEDIHQWLSKKLPPACHLINAGSGRRAHPTQALLDAMTIYLHKKQFKNLSIAILGDLKHSRVANSLLHILSKLGCTDIRLVAPKELQIESTSKGALTTKLEHGIQDCDVVVCLRVQKERFDDTESLDLKSYHEHYCLTQDKLNLAKDDAIVMHPGPMNRGIEIDSAVADGPQSVILEQVNNGVFMRMAVLSEVLRS